MVTYDLRRYSVARTEMGAVDDWEVNWDDIRCREQKSLAAACERGARWIKWAVHGSNLYADGAIDFIESIEVHSFSDDGFVRLVCRAVVINPDYVIRYARGLRWCWIDANGVRFFPPKHTPHPNQMTLFAETTV